MNAKIEHRELVYVGRVAKAYKVGLRMDDGSLVHRDLFCYGGAAVILPVMDDGDIVMIRNYRYAVDETLLELPAGMIEPGEDPLAGARRELTEETGFSAGAIDPLGAFFCAPGSSDQKMYAYLATGLVRGQQNHESYERITVETHTDRQVRRMVLDGTIHDAKTIAALSLYWLRKASV
ncbi:MAG: NUDIX hydrolase [Planctomycetota bacterium]|nr:NUDIX hydrolase [Planctomycetota bacterium]